MLPWCTGIGLQERYLGSRIESINPNFQLGIKYLPPDLLALERRTVLNQGPGQQHRRQSAVDVDDLLAAVRRFWDENTTADERTLFPPKELPPEAARAEALADLDAAWGDADEEDDGYGENYYGEGGEGGTMEYDETDDLPPNTWVILRSAEHDGQLYYYHTGTGETAWVDPEPGQDGAQEGDDGGDGEPVEEEWSDDGSGDDVDDTDSESEDDV